MSSKKSDFDDNEVTGVITISPAKTHERLKTARDYTIQVKEIGAGGMGVVKKATTIILPGIVETFAMKILDKYNMPSPDALKRFHREVSTLRKAKHNNIVRYEDYFETDKFAYLVMEYVAGSDLEDYVIHANSMNHEIVIALHFQILQALLYMYQEHDMFHRDIKPGNIFMVDGIKAKAMLIDFGNAKILYDDPKKMSLTMISGQMTGTPGYTAPEVSYDKFFEQSDVFSIACSMLFCLFAKNPFEVNNDFAASFAKIQEGLVEGALGRFEGTMLGQWLRINTSFEYKDRMTLSQAVHSLERMMKDPSYAMRKVKKDFVRVMGSDKAMMSLLSPEERENSQTGEEDIAHSNTLAFDPSMMTNPGFKLDIEELGEKVIQEEEAIREAAKKAEETKALDSLIDGSLEPARQEKMRKKKKRKFFLTFLFALLLISSFLGIDYYFVTKKKSPCNHSDESSEKVQKEESSSVIKKKKSKKKALKINKTKNLKKYKSIQAIYPYLKTRVKRKNLLKEADVYYEYAKANSNKVFKQAEWRWLAFLFKARVKNAQKLKVIEKLFNLYCYSGQKKQIQKMARKYKKYGAKRELSCP